MGPSGKRPSAYRTPSHEASRRGPLVLHVAVAVPVPVGLHPLEGAVGVREEGVDGVAGQAPPPQLAEQEDEQRGGVDGAVVDGGVRQRRRGCAAGAHLVEDAPRLLLRRRVDA
jgi:hypothetical protein